jgi:hypothetical protein
MKMGKDKVSRELLPGNAHPVGESQQAKKLQNKIFRPGEKWAEESGGRGPRPAFES